MGTYSTSKKTRRKLFAVAVDLFSKQGFDQTTTREIAAAADVSTATLFRYYPKKSDFLSEIGAESVDRLADFLTTIPKDIPLIDRITMLMAEDLNGHVGVLYERKKSKGVTLYRSLNVRMAHLTFYAADDDHLKREIEARQTLASYYKCILDDAKESGELLCSDTKSLSEAIMLMFFLGNEEATLSGDFVPLEDLFRTRVLALLEGKLS